MLGGCQGWGGEGNAKGPHRQGRATVPVRTVVHRRWSAYGKLGTDIKEIGVRSPRDLSIHI